MTTTSRSQIFVGRRSSVVLITAWAVVLLISQLPIIFFREVLHTPMPWLPWPQVCLLAIGLLLSLVVHAQHPLRQLQLFFALFLALYLAQWAVNTVAVQLQTQRVISTTDGSFVNSLAFSQVQRLGVALIMLAASWLLMRQRSAFFFTVGKLDAPAAPIKFVGMTRPSTWNKLGPMMALGLAGGLTAFIVIAGGAPLANLPKALPLLPFVVLFAVLNAFGEEMSYRAPQLGALAPVVGGGQSLLMTSVYFGIGHFYGVPYGIVGVVMAGLLGWLLGRSMLETKGFFWAWLIHFVMDTVIFTFMAVGSVTPGG